MGNTNALIFMQNTFNKTRDNIKKYHSEVKMTGGDTFDTVNTLKRIDLYYYSKFESGQYDSAGLRKYFFNIVKSACDVATKFIDLDTKNIVLYSNKMKDSFKVWLMTRELKYWLKENRFGQTINAMTFDLPKYGHIVLKQDKNNGIAKVNIQNIRTDPSIERLEDSLFVYEVHFMSRREIKAMKWDKQAVDDLLGRNPEEMMFTVYECYDQLPDTNKKWTRTFKTDFLNVQNESGDIIETAESQINDDKSFVGGIILHEDELDELPYKEHKWDNVAGRWLGMGFVEYLFDNQIRINEIVNTKARGLELAGLQIFQTSDDTITGNLLTDVSNGEIITTTSGITPIGTEARNLGMYSQEEARWDQNAQTKTFAFGISRGEELPSGTPLGVAKISAGMVDSYYGIKRENLGLFLRDILTNNIIPNFNKQVNKEHILKLYGSDEEIAKVRNAMVEYTMRKSIMDYMAKTGILPSKTGIEFEKMRLSKLAKREKDVELKIPKDFFSDIKYSIDITITGENIDIAQRNQSMMMILQLVGPQPQILQDPVTRTLITKMMELAGLSAVDLDMIQQAVDEQAQMPQQPQGQQPSKVSSSVQAPKSPVQPQAGQTTNSV